MKCNDYKIGAGPQGDRGPQGAIGDRGDTGANGVFPGFEGPTGPTGPQGEPSGTTGDTGPTGDRGFVPNLRYMYADNFLSQQGGGSLERVQFQNISNYSPYITVTANDPPFFWLAPNRAYSIFFTGFANGLTDEESFFTFNIDGNRVNPAEWGGYGTILSHSTIIQTGNATKSIYYEMRANDVLSAYLVIIDLGPNVP